MIGNAVTRTVLLVLLAIILAVGAADARPWSWLGVRIRDLSEQETEELAARHGIREGFGVVIVEVLADTPAARAGLQSGDIVVALEERPVTETRMLQRLIAAAPVERDSRLTVLRPGGRLHVPVRLVPMPRAVTGERVAAEFGFILRESDPPEAGGPRPPSRVPSVTVVLRGSAAEKGGLEVGDVILQVNDAPVVSREAAREALADVSTERPLRLTVRRGETRLNLTLSALRGP